MKRIFTTGTIFILLMIALQLDQYAVSAQSPLMSVDVSTLGFSLSVPSYFGPTPDKNFVTNSCIGYTAIRPVALAQVCRFADDGKSLDSEWALVKQSTVDGTNFSLFGGDGSANNYVTINGVQGEVGVFFYHGTTLDMGNMLFVGHDTNGDIVAVIYQADLSYTEGPQDAYNTIGSFGTNSTTN